MRALQNFAKDQISDQKWLLIQQFMQPLHLCTGYLVYLIYPDRAIDEDHR